VATSFPAGASVEDSCELDAVFGFEKRRGLAIWTGSTLLGAMITRVPRFVRCHSLTAKSFAKRMQP
jgi:hypothetical protein